MLLACGNFLGATVVAFLTAFTGVVASVLVADFTTALATFDR
jgi:hypothetical protein